MCYYPISAECVLKMKTKNTTIYHTQHYICRKGMFFRDITKSTSRMTQSFENTPDIVRRRSRRRTADILYLLRARMADIRTSSIPRDRIITVIAHCLLSHLFSSQWGQFWVLLQDCQWKRKTCSCWEKIHGWESYATHWIQEEGEYINPCQRFLILYSWLQPS